MTLFTAVTMGILCGAMMEMTGSGAAKVTM